MRFKREIMVVFLVLFLINSVSALRVSPAKIEINFKPGFETEITYNFDSNLNRYLEVYVRGDLAEYIELSKNEFFKEGQVTAYIRLPDEIEPPGPKRTYIGVREMMDEELAAGVLGTAVAIESLILIHVPYPGKYLETSLGAHNVNLGEPVTFNLNIISKGKEDLIMKPKIEIYSEYDELIEILNFREREIKRQEKIELKKTMNTTSYFSGDYYAISKIDYDVRTAESRADFKIGELSIEIINYTKQIILGGIRRFEIEIESGWNDKIDGAYAEIIILNSSGKVIEFKTSPTDLSPWQSKIIAGYLDTTGILPGIYDADVTVIYYGRDRGESLNKIIKVEFIEGEKQNYLLIGGVIVLSILAILILVYIIRDKIKNGKNKK